MTNTNIHSDPPQQNIDSTTHTSATQSQQPTAQPVPQVKQQTHPTDRDSLINRAADGVIDTVERCVICSIGRAMYLSRSAARYSRAMVTVFELENQARPRNAKLKPPQALPGYIVARIIMRTGAIRLHADRQKRPQDHCQAVPQRGRTPGSGQVRIMLSTKTITRARL